MLENVESLLDWLQAQGGDILLFKCPFNWLQEYNLVWEANWEHCNMHDRNKQQLSAHTHTHRAQPQITAQDARLPPLPAGIASWTWQGEMRKNWRTQSWENTSKTLISLGMDEELYCLYSSDDTEGVVIRGYFRICATLSELLHGQTLLLCWNWRGWSWLRLFSAFPKEFSGLCRGLMAPPVGCELSVLNHSACWAAAGSASQGGQRLSSSKSSALLPGWNQGCSCQKVPSPRAQPSLGYTRLGHADLPSSSPQADGCAMKRAEQTRLFS